MMTRRHRYRYLVPGERNDGPYRVRSEYLSEDGTRMLVQDWHPSAYDPFTTLNQAMHIPTGWSHTWRGHAEPWSDDLGDTIAGQLWSFAAKLGGFSGE